MQKDNFISIVSTFIGPLHTTTWANSKPRKNVLTVTPVYNQRDSLNAIPHNHCFIKQPKKFHYVTISRTFIP